MGDPRFPALQRHGAQWGGKRANPDRAGLPNLSRAPARELQQRLYLARPAGPQRWRDADRHLRRSVQRGGRRARLGHRHPLHGERRRGLRADRCEAARPFRPHRRGQGRQLQRWGAGRWGDGVRRHAGPRLPRGQGQLHLERRAKLDLAMGADALRLICLHRRARVDPGRRRVAQPDRARGVAGALQPPRSRGEAPPVRRRADRRRLGLSPDPHPARPEQRGGRHAWTRRGTGATLGHRPPLQSDLRRKRPAHHGERPRQQLRGDPALRCGADGHASLRRGLCGVRAVAADPRRLHQHLDPAPGREPLWNLDLGSARLGAGRHHAGRHIGLADADAGQPGDLPGT